MWIQVRSMDGKKSIQLDGLSKLTKIEEIREKLVEEFDAPVERQRLFYSGKMLVDGHTLYDYNVALNGLIQIMVRPVQTETISESLPTEQSETEPSPDEKVETEPPKEEEQLDSTYKMGDIVDCRDETMGAWFEARLLKITRATKKVEQSEDDKMTENMTDNNIEDTNKVNGVSVDAEKSEKNVKNCPFYSEEDDGFVYHAVFDGYEDEDAVELPVRHIRPRARHKLSLNDIAINDRIMVNYNYDEPDTRGYWYDAIVTGKRNTRTIKEVTATVYIGKDLVPFQDCKIIFVDELFKIEEVGSQLNVNRPVDGILSPAKREFSDFPPSS